jgi:hypothetical protein
MELVSQSALFIFLLLLYFLLCILVVMGEINDLDLTQSFHIIESVI